MVLRVGEGQGLVGAPEREPDAVHVGHRERLVALGRQTATGAVAPRRRQQARLQAAGNHVGIHVCRNSEGDRALATAMLQVMQ